VSNPYVRPAAGTPDEVGKRLEAAVKAHGFGVLNVIDLQAKLKEKGVEFGHACRIFEICNPQQAKQMLEKSLAVATLLPCRVAVYDEGGQTQVATLAATQLIGLLGNTELTVAARAVERELTAIVAAAAAP
jgi:uncharacterized protein (DUF302 family)